MKRSEALERLRQACRRHRHSLHTERDYVGHARRFLVWCSEHPLPPAAGGVSATAMVTAYLSARAGGWSASSQSQALCALVFLFKEGLGRPLGTLPAWTAAVRPRRLPEWLTDEEARRVLSFLRDEAYLACALMYGAGLRRREVVSLRLGNFNLAEGSVTVRGGKGEKDRVTCLPRALQDEVCRQLARAQAVHAQDRAAGQPPVFVAPELLRKYPAACAELRHFWFFPAAGESRDPRSGIVRRHHLHEDTLAKQLRRAAVRAGIVRRVSCHALRHSFATQYLQNGGMLHELKELLGHASLQTTEIYLHCLPRLGARVSSPLDVRAVAGKLVAFPDLTSNAERRTSNVELAEVAR